MKSHTSNISAIFLGTPHFALESLKALCLSGITVSAVITQPDKRSGRGQQLSPPPVKEWATNHGLPVFQPVSVRGFKCDSDGICSGLSDSEGLRLTAALSAQSRPDLLVVVAYGKILPEQMLSFPRVAAVNVHASLLPRWRGAAPIQRALLAGDRATGVCIMQMKVGLDTGPVYAESEIPIESSDTFGSLHDKLAQLGSKLLVESLPAIISGQQPVPQRLEGISYADKWEKPDTVINWDDTAELINNRIRACSPQPGARTKFLGEVVKVTRATVAHDSFVGTWENGTVVMASPAELVVSAGDSSFVSIQELQFPGRKRLPISEILKGREIPIGERFLEI